MGQNIEGRFDENMNGDNTTVELNGGTYTGETSNGTPNGLGAWVHSDGQAYVGSWSHGNFDGHVALIFPGGKKYVGECKHLQFYSSTARDPAEDREYEEIFNDRLFHGRGTLTDIDGSKYVGEWQYGERWNGARWEKGQVTAT